MKLFRKYIAIIASLFLLFTVASCGIYSFTGANPLPKGTTFFVEDFPNRARLVNPNLSSKLVEDLKDKLINQTNMDLNDNSPNLEFSGQITGYEVRPMAISAEEVAEKNRLTVTVKVKFVNNENHDLDFDSSFSAFADFTTDRILSEVEDELMEEIVEQLTEDIFNKAIVNW
ncbi:hypothetical protein EMN47_18270 [Prolixibacteraceae bacterium JC049]|nr:hypothetical protein [Prolixibacteraceae bacterium JC049]